MSVIKEFLLFTAGMIITVSLAIVSFNIYMKAAVLGRGIAEREQIAIDELEEFEVMRFDGCVIDGSRAISYIKRIYGTRNIPIEVKKGGKTFTVDDKAVSELRKTNSSFYLSPLEKYRVSVLTDENDSANRIKIELD